MGLERLIWAAPVLIAELCGWCATTSEIDPQRPSWPQLFSPWSSWKSASVPGIARLMSMLPARPSSVSE